MGRGGQLSLLRHLRSPLQGTVAEFCRTASSAYGGRGTGVCLIRRSLTSSCSLPPLHSLHCLPSLIPLSSTHSLVRLHSSHPSAPSAPSSPDFSQLPGARKPRKAQAKPVRTLEISKPQAQNAFDHCLSLVQKHDFENYVAALLMPKKAQAEVFAILALNVELAQIRDKVAADHKSTTGIYRLQFWRDAIQAIYSNSPSPIPRQPVAVSLCCFAPFATPSLLETIVAARQDTIGDRQFASVKDVCSYGERTWGSIIRLTVDALSRPRSLTVSDEVHRAAMEMGIALGLANMIRAALPLLSRGIILLPSDLFTLHGLSPDKVYKQKQKEESKMLIKDLAKVAASHLATARSLKSEIPKELRPAFLSPGATVDHVLKVCSKVDNDLFSPHLQRRNPLHPWRVLGRKLTSNY